VTIYHIISAGYEGASTEGIVEGPEANIEVLFEEFMTLFGLAHETDIFKIKNERELKRQMDVQWWIMKDLIAHGYETEWFHPQAIFVEWLIKDRGYRRIETIIVDIGDDFLDVRRERRASRNER
jgi:hypothetical protein